MDFWESMATDYVNWPNMTKITTEILKIRVRPRMLGKNIWSCMNDLLALDQWF